jgi:hypothetical protein
MGGIMIGEAKREGTRKAKRRTKNQKNQKKKKKINPSSGRKLSHSWPL